MFILSVRQALSWACNISAHERQCFITAGLDSFKASGPCVAVNERMSIDFSWKGIKPFKHAMKWLSKAYELEPGIYQVCVMFYVEIGQQLCFHTALARNQERLGDFNQHSHGAKLEEIFLQHPVGRNLVVCYPIVFQQLWKAAGFFAVVLGSTEALLSLYLQLVFSPVFMGGKTLQFFSSSTVTNLSGRATAPLSAFVLGQWNIPVNPEVLLVETCDSFLSTSGMNCRVSFTVNTIFQRRALDKSRLQKWNEMKKEGENWYFSWCLLDVKCPIKTLRLRSWT